LTLMTRGEMGATLCSCANTSFPNVASAWNPKVLGGTLSAPADGSGKWDPLSASPLPTWPHVPPGRSTSIPSRPAAAYATGYGIGAGFRMRMFYPVG
jgi:hypothetical protein